MIKKILSIICIICICITTLTACSNKNSSNVSSETSSSNSEIAITEIETGKIYQPEDLIDSVNTDQAYDSLFGETKSISFYGKDDWSDCIFYIFDTVEDTDKAFNYIKTNMLKEGTFEESDTWVKGEDANVINMTMLMFYYKTNNMIISRLDFTADPEIGVISESEVLKEKNDARHEEIFKTW